MYKTLSLCIMLLVVLAGYLVLIKAYAQEGKLRTLGQIVSLIVIIVGFIGIICSAISIHSKYSYKKEYGCNKPSCCNYQKQCEGYNKDELEKCR